MVYGTYNDLNFGLHGFQCDGTAGNKPAASHRDDGGVDVGHLLQNFQSHCPLSSQNVRMVKPECINRLQRKIQRLIFALAQLLLLVVVVSHHLPIDIHQTSQLMPSLQPTMQAAWTMALAAQATLTVNSTLASHAG